MYKLLYKYRNGDYIDSEFSGLVDRHLRGNWHDNANPICSGN